MIKAIANRFKKSAAMKTGNWGGKRNGKLPICLIKNFIECFLLFLGLGSELRNSSEQKIIC